MTIEAKFLKEDGTCDVQYFTSYITMGAWADQHWRDYIAFDAKTIPADEIKQGRESNA